MSITAVAFDYGGVISLPQDEQTMRDLASLAGLTPELMRRLYWEGRSSYDRGLDGGDYFKNILAEAGVFPDNSVIDLMIERDISGWARINPDTEALMGDIKRADLKLGVLSNMPRPFLEKIMPSLPVLALPDAAVYSCVAGTVKPEEKIYGLLLSALGCEAGELVFFDDTEINVEAAGKLGIRAFVWAGAENARRELEVLCAGRFNADEQGKQ